MAEVHDDSRDALADIEDSLAVEDKVGRDMAHDASLAEHEDGEVVPGDADV